MLSVDIKSVDIINTDPSRRILTDIRFTLEQGNIYTILGNNGSGKSTLISALTELLDTSIYDTMAEVRLDGNNIYDISTNELLNIRREKIRYVFQDAVNSFDPLKIFKYYFNMQSAGEKEIDELLKYFLLPHSEKLFKLYPYEVSGGMAQRISVCLAILAKPQILILDEPTSAIDINISNLLCAKLKEFVNEFQSSVLLITQDLDFAEQVSDYIAHLRDGTLSNFHKVTEYKNVKSETE